MKLNLYILTTFLFLSNVRITALTQADSLESRMASKAGTEKVDALNDLAQYYRNINPQKGLDYAAAALKLSQQLNYSAGTADSYTNMGFCHSNLSNFTSARDEHKNALEIRKKNGDKKKIAASLNNIGEVMEPLGNNEQAISYFFEAIKIEEEINDLKGLSTSYSLVATIYYILKQYDKSIEFSEKALSTRQKINDKEGMANSYELLGLASYSKENTGDALRYHTVALDLRTQIKDKIGMGGSLHNLGMVHKLRKNYPLALEYYGKALALRQETGDKRGIGSSYNAMAQIYELQGKDELALDYIQRAFKIRLETNDKRGTASSYHMLSDIYKKMGNYKKAYEYLAIFHNYRDSLNAAQSLQKLTAMNYQYKNEKKDQEIALLQKDNIIQKTVRNFVIAGLLFVTIISVVIFLAYKGKMRSNKLLEEKNLEISKREEELLKLNEELKLLNATKDKFFSILAHDLRSPFFGLMGLTEELFKNISEMEKEEIINFAEIINQSANKLFSLLNNLLDWSAIQSERIKAKPDRLNLLSEVENIINLFDSSALSKSIIIQKKIRPDMAVFADKNMVEAVLRNLVSNAIKFTNIKGQITIEAEPSGNFTKISVTDTGIGMKEFVLDKIFRIDSVYTSKGTNGEDGTGLGLILCKELVEKNGGTITAISTPGKGTTFSFTLPSISLN